MRRGLSGFFWLTAYLVVIFAPLFFMLVRPIPSGRDFVTELSIALGFVGLTQMAVQFVLIARFKRVTAPYGIDLILQYHKQIAVVAILLILAHPVLLMIQQPWRLELLNPLRGNWASRFALLSVLCLLLLWGLSAFRKQIRMNYEAWRLSHLFLSVLALVSAQIHVALAGLYTNTWWKHALWIAMSAFFVGVVVWLRLIKPAQQRRQPWRVTAVRPERGETHTLALEPVGHSGFRFHPGQFAWIKVDASPYTIDEHPYSFSSSSERGGQLEFGIKELGDFSANIKNVPVGATAYVDGPHGAFSIDRYPATGYFFFAGGVGITPFMSFLHTMADRGDPRPVLLFYAGKTWEALTYREEIERLRELLDLEVVYVLEEPPEDWEPPKPRVRALGAGTYVLEPPEEAHKIEEGFVTADILRRRLPQESIHREAFICGPAPFMDAVRDALLEVGVDAEHIHMEQFDLV
ncbi:oxidoreductase FAD/NAD(P)-binding domain protein [Truepera radiovictrix DSM 17093]|uniref:Oxidoreductase FAD/NAD(P)-binding domain protein n=1 Tax=Truepera radiovictrix (strain DSM 17093 / CIP 108686 / LMG 22925 / RQ-24) TaxID=649638 RepID=D7CS13_TRURR|nr:oxidoreductase FAD/NAD(P)-binding domain protein [Truepera radiovictrix DSM 17093]